MTNKKYVSGTARQAAIKQAANLLRAWLEINIDASHADKCSKALEYAKLQNIRVLREAEQNQPLAEEIIRLAEVEQGH